MEKGKWCGNCLHYDGAHCTKEWNNGDYDFYIDWRDSKNPEEYCDDWEEE